MSTTSSALPVVNRTSPWAKAATALIILAGIIHLVVTPIHWAHAPAHGVFFALVGVLQIAWGIAFWRRPSTWLYAAGWVLAGSLVVLWIITRFWVAPFHGVAEPVDLGGVVCKLAEVLGLISLTALALTGSSTAEQRRGAWRNLALLLILSVVVGLATYGVARAAEPLFPALAASHEHSEDHEQDADHEHDADHSHGEMQDTGQTPEAQPQPDHTHEHGSDSHTH